MTFLPSNYEVPQAPSGYMKLQEGTNRFRILSSAVTGYEYWNVENKPVRSREAWKLVPPDIKINEDGSFRIAHFWAFVVWNYQENLIQILQITQATIQRAMKIKIDNRKGDAKGYDFIVTRTGKGLLTDYDIDVSEASPLTPEIEAAYQAKSINLDALFDGGDPFGAVLPQAKQVVEHAEVEAALSEDDPFENLSETPFDDVKPASDLRQAVAKTSGAKFAQPQ